MGFVTKLFKPKTPKAPSMPAPAPAPPTVDTAGVQAAADAERKRQRAAAGRASTMLTSGKGLTESATIGTKELLG